MEITIKQLGSGEAEQFTELIRVFETVFEMQDLVIPDSGYLEQLLRSGDFAAFVALADGQVAGGLTAYVMRQYYSTAPLIYIYDLAVSSHMQRQGVGRMLVEAVKSYGSSVGAELVMVEAEEQDEHAISFYQSTGAKGIKTVHFEYHLAATDNLNQQD
jgi:ribosomal protein S18 acetylase RimI-like enzyme